MVVARILCHGSSILFTTSKFNWIAAFVALMLLRMVVGFHFFIEGTDKFQSGDFTAEYFLRAATGPLAPYYHSLLNDEDGRMRMCVKELRGEDGIARYDLDPELTFALWDDFVDRAVSYYRLGDVTLEQSLIDRRERLAQEIRRARSAGDTSVDVRALERQRRDDEVSILKIRTQIEDAEEILEQHQQELQSWLDANRTEVIAFYGTEDRLDGFDRDGAARQQVAMQVASLREQVDKIASDRQKQLSGWNAEVEAIWNSLETQINDLAVDSQADRADLALHRPFRQENSKLKWINRFIPWFDTTVGVLLILGLFTRFASLLGIGFLASVIATQPPWIPAAEPTIYQTIELFALVTIFATCAGRMGGLDFFLTRLARSPASRTNQETLEAT